MAWTHKETFGQGVTIGLCDAPPNLGPGLAAGVGSLAVCGGARYRKTGAGDADWSIVDTAIVTGSNDADTSSTSPVLIEGAGSTEQMTITPGAGYYIVWLNCQAEALAAPTSVVISIYGAGVQVADSDMARLVSNATEPGSVTTIAQVVVGAGETIEGRFATTNGARAVRVTMRRLVVMRVA
jgi:hypothetical protein